MTTPPGHHESMLLLTLGEISRLVANSHDLRETLQNIVVHIRDRFRTDVCSVYLRQPGEPVKNDLAGEPGTAADDDVHHDRSTESTQDTEPPESTPGSSGESASSSAVEKQTPPSQLVLEATVGLRNEAVGKIRLAIGEGLTGLVAERQKAVWVDNAPAHPQFRFFPESGEEKFMSFLGVPMMQGGTLEGVLVIQHAQPRRYSASEVYLLSGVAAQLGILVTNARLTNELARAAQALADRNKRTGIDHVSSDIELVAPAPASLTGSAASKGCGLGRARCFAPFDFDDPAWTARPAASVNRELARLHSALQGARDGIDRAAQHLAELLGESFGALLQTQRLMLEDSSLQRELDSLIKNGSSVEEAVLVVCRHYLAAYQKLDNPFFYERIYDVKDVFRRLLMSAADYDTEPDQQPDDESKILVASEVSLLELFSSDLARVTGVAVEQGGSFSHVAILARSLGLPMLTQVSRLTQSVRSGDSLIIDADAGLLWINPPPDRVEIYQQSSKPNWGTFEVGENSGDDDTLPLRLESTVNLLPEVNRTVEVNAKGVGLYRTEFLELARRSFPSEAEQLEMYRQVLKTLDGRRLTLRTLDLRSDKLYGLSQAPTMAWDWRLVDQLPHVQDLIVSQLRAIFRAAVDGPTRVLFPMIGSDRQWQCACRLADQARQSLKEDKLSFDPDVPLGPMVEVAAAVWRVRHWMPQAGFVSIGSNDLLHSVLGIERDDEHLTPLKTPLDPAFLLAVRHIVRRAHAHRRPVTLCGEAASHPLALFAFWILEVDALSCPPMQIPAARQLLRQTPLPDDRARLVAPLLAQPGPAEVEAFLLQHFPNVAQAK